MSGHRKRIVVKKRSHFPRKLLNKVRRNWIFILITLGGLAVGLVAALAVTGNLSIGLPSFGAAETADK